MKLFDYHNVTYEYSDMSLSVSNINNGIEWSGKSINTIFADRKRIFDINFLKFFNAISKITGKGLNALEIIMSVCKFF